MHEHPGNSMGSYRYSTVAVVIIATIIIIIKLVISQNECGSACLFQIPTLGERANLKDDYL